MALPSKILLTKTQLIHHLDLPKDKVDRYCVALEKYPAEEGTVGHSYRYLLRDVVQAMAEHVATHAKGRVADDPKARAELARAVGMETKNNIANGNYISKLEVIAKEAQKAAIVARSLDAIVPNVKRKYPNVKPEFLASVSDEIARARNSLADTLKREAAQNAPVEAADPEDLFA